MATGVIQVGDVGDWTQYLALKKERRLRWWIHFEDENNRIVYISGCGV